MENLFLRDRRCFLRYGKCLSYTLKVLLGIDAARAAIQTTAEIENRGAHTQLPVIVNWTCRVIVVVL